MNVTRPSPLEALRARTIAEATPVVFTLRAAVPVALWVASSNPLQLGLPLNATLAFSLIANAILCAVARRRPRLRGWAEVDAGVNLLLTTAIVHLTGGPANPLLATFALQAAIYALVFGRSTAIFFVTGASTLIALLAVAQLPSLGLAGSLPAAVALDATTATWLEPVVIAALAFGMLPLTRHLWEHELLLGVQMEQSQEALSFQTPLADLAIALQTNTKQNEIARLVCERYREMLAVDGVFLWLGDETLTPAGGSASAEIDVSTVLATEPTMMNGRGLRHTGQCVIGDVATSPYAHHPFLKRFGTGSMLLLPLIGKQFPLGMMVFVDRQRTGRFDDMLLRRSKLLAAQAAAAIDGAAMVERIEHEADRIESLLTLSEELGSSTDLAQVMRSVAERARRLVHCDDAIVLLWEAAKDAFVFGCRAGDSVDILPGMETKAWPREGIQLAERLHSGETVLFPGGEIVRLLSTAVATNFDGPMIAVAMVTQAGTQGALLLGRTQEQPWSPTDRQMAEGIAQYSGIAVENARLVDNLRQADRLKSEFVATMSHELRTPLNIITGISDMMIDGVHGSLNDEQLDRMAVVRHNALAQLELVNETLDLSRLQSGRLPINLSKFTVPEFFRELEVENQGNPHKKANVALRFEIPKDITPLVTDRLKVKTIANNLVRNALKFTDQGSVTVRAQLKMSEGTLELTVQDTGTGIKPEDQKFIFEMFRQVDQGDTRKVGGVGLGLHTVKRYCEQLGGEISVESTPGEGSTFRVRLPVTEHGAPLERRRITKPQSHGVANTSAKVVNG